ncbi:MAG: hypothetical protein AAFN92_07835 [Bacteroidota bacterium]
MSLPGSTPISGANEKVLRNLLFLYFFLLLFEGALRKWLVPGLAGPLTIVRDPLALLIIGYYFLAGKRLLNQYTLTIILVGILSFLFSLGTGHGNILIGIYGLRTLVLHFLLIFVFGTVLTRGDVEKIGRWLLLLAIPATILVGLQFYSPQSAWVNRGVGGDMEGSGFSGAMGYFRPAGLFSFTNGNTLFFALIAAYVAYFWTNRQRCSKLLLIAATACVIIVIPLSISRTYVFHVVLTGLFLLLASVRSTRSFLSMLIPLLCLPVIFFLLSQFEFMETATEVLSTRFEQAAKSEGGTSGSIGSRIFGTMTEAITGGENGSVPLWGHGLGLGTNVGSVLLSGEKNFQIAEAEWPRIVGEMGPILGLIVLLLRTLLCAHVAFFSFRWLRRGNALPFMLASFSLPLILVGGWAQPTNLGFFTLAAGLTIAAGHISVRAGH